MIGLTVEDAMVYDEKAIWDEIARCPGHEYTGPVEHVEIVGTMRHRIKCAHCPMFHYVRDPGQGVADRRGSKHA
jgi:hypothetical protein